MDLSGCLPEYFAIKASRGYYVYQNTVYQSSDTDNIPISVLWPTLNATLKSMSSYSANICPRNTLTRKWNSEEYIPSSWVHTGKEVEMVKKTGLILIIPVIDIAAHTLPYNNNQIEPTNIIPDVSPRRGIDTKARFFTVDPVHTIKNVVESNIPPHIKKIVIQDAVRNNLECPISSEPITLTNSVVTSCGHVFIENEIKIWLSMEISKSLCPSCKQKCSV